MFFRLVALIIGFGLISIGYEIYTTSYWSSGKWNYNFDFTGFNIPASIFFFLIGLYFIYLFTRSIYKYFTGKNANEG